MIGLKPNLKVAAGITVGPARIVAALKSMLRIICAVNAPKIERGYGRKKGKQTMLREYQTRVIDELYKWLASNAGHPCVVMPTGSGKSHIVAALCKDALQQWPETRILMLTHVKELIEQNAEKMRQHWPDAPLGIYSASIGLKQFDHITFAGIQSIRKKADQLGHIDLVIID